MTRDDSELQNVVRLLRATLRYVIIFSSNHTEKRSRLIHEVTVYTLSSDIQLAPSITSAKEA